MIATNELQKLDEYLKICKPHERPLLEAKRARLTAEITGNPFEKYSTDEGLDFGKWIRDIKSESKRK